MAKAMTPEKRVSKARELIKKAHEIPVPNSVGWEFLVLSQQMVSTPITELDGDIVQKDGRNEPDSSI